jgi:spermidine synthase
LGSVTLVAILGAIQVGLGGFWGWYVARMRAGAAARLVGGSVIVLVSVTLGWLAWHPDLVLPTPLYQEDSPYQQIRVRDTDLHRYLILDRTFHAVMWRVEPVELFLPYSQMMMAALSLVDQPRRALILGHGGGSLAKWLAKYWPELDVDVVEVDPSVVLAAERFFNYSPPPRHHVYVRDARVFLQSTAARYDIIWVDVFARHLIPFHLTTREFFEVVRDHLTPDGVIAVNLSSAGTPADRLRSHAVVSTLRTQFPEIVAYGVKGPFVTKEPDTENLIFFAGSPARRLRDAGIVERIDALIDQRRLPRELRALVRLRRDQEWQTGVLLTDDFAPYDVLMGS